jgi:hypothetical protein
MHRSHDPTRALLARSNSQSNANPQSHSNECAKRNTSSSPNIAERLTSSEGTPVLWAGIQGN